MDPIIQAVGGVMSVTGYPESGPTAIGAPLADVLTGMFGAYSIVGMLHAVRQDGRGRYIDVSMQAAMLATLGPRMGGALNAGIAPGRIGNQNPMRMPSDVYTTRDGASVFVMVHHDRQWAPFCRAMQSADWLEEARFATNRLRCDHRDELNRLVFERFADYDVAEITSRLEAERVPHAVVNDYVRAVADEQALDRGVVQEVTHRDSGAIRVIGPPWIVDGQSVKVGPPPALDEHADAILRNWLEWTPEQIRRFRAAGSDAGGAA